MPRKCIDKPVVVPEAEANLPDAIATIFDRFASKAVALVRRLGLPTDAAAFAELERSLFRLVGMRPVIPVYRRATEGG